MKNFTLPIILFWAAASWAFFGCELDSGDSDSPTSSTSSPDLTLVNDPSSGQGAYCNIPSSSSGYNFNAKVKNSGGISVSALFEVKASFESTDATATGSATTGISVGETITIGMTFPADCYDDDTGRCEFTLTIDPDGAIKESNEDNNSVEGVCFDE